MSQHAHAESHFTANEFVRDVVIGMADGLTVPFALAAGLSGAVSATHLVVVAGLAEVAAGSIAMGLGGYLAARNDAEHYASERRREEREVAEIPEQEAHEVVEVFTSYGLTREESLPIVDSLRQRPESWIDFMMRFELGLEEPDPRRAVRSASTIAASYIAGGLIPLFPYMLMPKMDQALLFSIAVTLAALALFGYIRGRYSGVPPASSALRTTLIGGLAAAAAFLLAKAIS
jgi:VIT1/CCC1 family predicted Fe2+/Mn2+ transporter